MRYLKLTLFRYFAFEFIAVFHFRECSCTRQARQNAPPEGARFRRLNARYLAMHCLIRDAVD